MAYIKGYKTTATLKKGSKGEAVKQLQYRLANVTVDGIFGPKTEASVKGFQKAKKLSVTGIAEKTTLTALGMYGSTTTTTTPTTTTPTTTPPAAGGPSALPSQMLDKVIGGAILYGIYKTFQKIF